MHPSLQNLSHRPWPLPKQEWSWRQSWLDLAFIHYPIDAAALRPLLPKGLTLQSYNGTAWLGLVPFRMAGVMRRPWPDLPYFSSFPELNLRTYVEAEGKPGVWFFSLDADSLPVVLGGRFIYGLPYFTARMRQKWSEGRCTFSSVRRNGHARFAGHYRPVGDVFSRSRAASNSGRPNVIASTLSLNARAFPVWKFIMRLGHSKTPKSR
jgi:uncharacterized protein YqjF (DUF2071 family)